MQHFGEFGNVPKTVLYRTGCKQHLALFIYFCLRNSKHFIRSVQYRGMKTQLSALIIALFILLPACENGPILSSYRPVLPELPGYWKEILGEAHWRLEWIGKEGTWLEWEGSPGQAPPGLSLIQ